MVQATAEVVRAGRVAAGILKVICTAPEHAYLTGLGRFLRKQKGSDDIRDHDVQNALRLLVADGLLERENRRDPMFPRRVMYRPTWKATFYVAMFGGVAKTPRTV